MFRSCNLFLVFIFTFLPFFVFGQETMVDLKEDIFKLMHNNTTSKNKKTTKKFFRILKSKDFSSELNFQVKLVLLDFQDRNLGFHSHYINFFDLVLECEKTQEKQLLLSNILGFLISRSNSLSNLDLKHFFSRLSNVCKYKLLSSFKRLLSFKRSLVLL